MRAVLTIDHEEYFDALEAFARLYADLYSEPGREAAFYGACELMRALTGLTQDDLMLELRSALEVIGEDPEMYGF